MFRSSARGSKGALPTFLTYQLHPISVANLKPLATSKYVTRTTFVACSVWRSRQAACVRLGVIFEGRVSTSPRGLANALPPNSSQKISSSVPKPRYSVNLYILDRPFPLYEPYRLFSSARHSNVLNFAYHQVISQTPAAIPRKRITRLTCSAST